MGKHLLSIKYSKRRKKRGRRPNLVDDRTPGERESQALPQHRQLICVERHRIWEGECRKYCLQLRGGKVRRKSLPLRTLTRRTRTGNKVSGVQCGSSRNKKKRLFHHFTRRRKKRKVSGTSDSNNRFSEAHGESSILHLGKERVKPYSWKGQGIGRSCHSHTSR